MARMKKKRYVLTAAILAVTILGVFWATQALAGGTGRSWAEKGDGYRRPYEMNYSGAPRNPYYDDYYRSDGYYRDMDAAARNYYERRMDSGAWDYYDQDRRAMDEQYRNWANDVEARARDYYYWNQDTRARDYYYLTRDNDYVRNYDNFDERRFSGYSDGYYDRFRPYDGRSGK